MKKVLALIILFVFMFSVVGSIDLLAKGQKKSLWKKMTCKVKKAGAAINNKTKDSYVSAKKKVTGKKDKTWVKGHCTTKNGNKHWTKGHWRKVKQTSSQGNSQGPVQGPSQGNSQGPVQGPGQGASQR
ncbi:hypothetical protein KAJ27_09325 [bacterium]|nr:hypothetical protein [bacterium]